MYAKTFIRSLLTAATLTVATLASPAIGATYGFSLFEDVFNDQTMTLERVNHGVGMFETDDSATGTIVPVISFNFFLSTASQGLQVLDSLGDTTSVEDFFEGQKRDDATMGFDTSTNLFSSLFNTSSTAGLLRISGEITSQMLPDAQFIQNSAPVVFLGLNDGGNGQQNGGAAFLATAQVNGSDLTFDPTNRFELQYEISGMAAVPVPASLPLLLAGFAGLGLLRRRRKSA